MTDTKDRLLQARRELHRLELQIEQYHLHLSELAAHPHEADRARFTLERLITELGTQRKYCDLLEKSVESREVERRDSSNVA
jgi:hypothetical protein